MVANFQHPHFNILISQFQFSILTYSPLSHSKFLFIMLIFSVLFHSYFYFLYSFCLFARDILIRNSYAPEGTPVWLCVFPKSKKKMLCFPGCPVSRALFYDPVDRYFRRPILKKRAQGRRKNPAARGRSIYHARSHLPTR